MTRIHQDGFSAHVTLGIIVDGQRIDIAKVGPKTLRLRQPMQGLEGKAAKLIMTVGSTRKTQDIILSKCSPTDPKEVSYW
jgi:hypothetical protein